MIKMTITKEQKVERINTARNFLIDELNGGGKIYYQKVGYTTNNRVYTFWLIKDKSIPHCVNYHLNAAWNIRRQKDTGCLIMDETDISSLQYHFSHKMGLDESISYIHEVIW